MARRSRVAPTSTSIAAANRRTSRQLWAGFGAIGLAKTRASSGSTRGRRQRHVMLATQGRLKVSRMFNSRLHPRSADGRFRRK